MSKLQFLYSRSIVCSAMAIVFFGVCIGSVYCAGAQTGNEMNVYLNSFFSGVKNSDCFSIFINSFLQYMCFLASMFICSFFKAGIVPIVYMTAKKGFVIGFTVASFFKVFQKSGFLAALSMLPELCLLVTAVVFFSSVCIKMALFHSEERKKFLIFFVIFSLFFLTIFCGVSFLNGYVTTRFMNLISSKIL